MSRTNIFILILSIITIIVFGIKIYYLKFYTEPEKINYSKVMARENIRNNKIMLITDNKEKYKLNKKYRYTKAFGFDYIYETKEDYSLYLFMEEGNTINAYNSIIEDYITSKDSFWYDKIAIIEDSLMFLKADNYGKKYDIDLSSLKVPAKEDLPKTMIKALERQRHDAIWIFSIPEDDTINAAKHIFELNADSLLYKIETNKKYHYTFVAEYWMAFHYEEVLIELIEMVENNTEIGLINTANLIILERIASGDLQFYGHGGGAEDDLFKVGGRANHILKAITGEDFGNVSMYHNDDDLKKMQNRWAYWLKNLNKRNWF